jgi:aryl-alcohol dehydrogenase-like predicted oxidoreductase
MGVADVPQCGVPDETIAVELIRHALDLGINFRDKASIYGDSEIKVGKALQDRRDGLVLAPKFAGTTIAARLEPTVSRRIRNSSGCEYTRVAATWIISLAFFAKSKNGSQVA